MIQALAPLVARVFPLLMLKIFLHGLNKENPIMLLENKVYKVVILLPGNFFGVQEW